MSTLGKARNLLLLSSSRCHGYGLLEFAQTEIQDFLNSGDIKEILFVPYADADFNYDKYTNTVGSVINKWGYKLNGIHQFENPKKAVSEASAIYIGGGNTFLLLKSLYENGIVDLIRDRVMSGDLLYMGSSAGTNVATKSINTTNDMPIVYPPTFYALQLVPFNINPHYFDEVHGTHKGETREERIREYLNMPNSEAVLGLREGAILHVTNEKAKLKGVSGAVLFRKNQPKQNFEQGTDMSFLLD